MAAPVRSKKRELHKRAVQNQMESDTDDQETDFSDDSDVEHYNHPSSGNENHLQRAFARGELKPGLNVQVEKKTFINNVPAMKKCLEEIRLDLPWIERLDIVVKPAPVSALMQAEMAEEDVNDDFKREQRFYRLAQSAVLEALPRLKKLGIPTRRPDDYFAEMVKSDIHMKKVRENLMAKKVGLERSERAKKLRDLRKYGKKVQQEVLLNRQKQKKDMLEAVKKFRKGQKDKLDFLDDDKPSGIRKKKQTEADRQPKVNKKREYKNEKFGHGGQKKRSKYNTKESASVVTGFSGRINSNMRKNNGKARGSKKSGSAKRPGKSRRQSMKNKKR